MAFNFCPQLDSSDCGVACVQMILSYYGKHYSLNTIKKYCPTSKLGVTIEQIIDVLKKFQIRSIPITPTLKEVMNMPIPAILYFKRGHFVVLHKVKKGTYFIADPGFGLVKLTEETLRKEWCTTSDYGIALLTAPNPNFDDYCIEEEPRKNLLYNLFHLTKGQLKRSRKTIGWSLFLLVFGMILSWLSPFMYKNLIDLGINNKQINIVFLFAILQFSSFIGGFIASSYSNLLLSKTGFIIGVDLLSKYLLRLSTLPLSFFDSKLSTDLIQRVDDQSRIESFLTKTLITSIFSGVNILVFLVILIQYNWYIGLVFISFSIITFCITRIFIRKRERIDYLRFSENANNKNNIYELINGIYDIRINGAQKTMINKWKKSQDSINNTILKTIFIDHYLNLNNNIIDKAKEVLILVVCSFFVINSQLTIGVMMTIMYLLGMLSGFSSNLMHFLTEFQYTKMAHARLNEILVKTEENDNTSIRVSDIKDDIILDNVSFHYPDMPKRSILSDINITIPLNKITAIVGHSGSGKTTLLKLLMGFYRPSGGTLTIGGIDIDKLNTDDWRNICGVVMQDGQIFSATIAENIALSEVTPDADRINKAIEIACLSDFIKFLPLKTNTPIGRSGINLSGGQKQRILIARAVYKNPDFVFLDEATSSLDANTEARIIKNLHSFYMNKTVVIIAHRLSTVKLANNIVYLENGKVAEQGSHQKLINLRGKYYALVKNQLGGNTDE